jgi:hypothetical protein
MPNSLRGLAWPTYDRTSPPVAWRNSKYIAYSKTAHSRTTRVFRLAPQLVRQRLSIRHAFMLLQPWSRTRLSACQSATWAVSGGAAPGPTSPPVPGMALRPAMAPREASKPSRSWLGFVWCREEGRSPAQGPSFLSVASSQHTRVGRSGPGSRRSQWYRDPRGSQRNRRC